MQPRTFAAAAMAFVLLACTAHHTGPRATDSNAGMASTAQAIPTRSAAGLRRFSSPGNGFRLDYPSGMAAHPDFSHGDLANAAWKTFAGPDSAGRPVLELVLPGSNHITTAALRIGISHGASEIERCTTPAKTAQPSHTHQVVINGATFTSFDAGDAAMSHYLQVHSYRSVHAGRCYAIDLLVTGTRPQAYSPAATPPFSHKQAFARLQHALQGFHFLRSHDKAH